jgi:hypothetical protein
MLVLKMNSFELLVTRSLDESQCSVKYTVYHMHSSLPKYR